MANFADEYLKNLKAKRAQAPAPVPSPAPAPAPAPSPEAPVAPANPEENKFPTTGSFLRDFRYELLNKLTSNDFGSVPDQQTFDSMSPVQKIGEVAKGGLRLAGNLITSLPVELVKAPLYLYATGKQFVKNVSEGKPLLTPEDEVMMNTSARLGDIPSWFKTRDDALKAGYGELAADLMTGSKALGDISIGLDLATSLKSAVTPRRILKPGEQVQNITPIKMVLEKGETTKVIPKKESVNEYYSLPKTEAKKWGGSSSDTFVKLTPSKEGQMEVSVVRLDKKGNSIGDFGPETKLKTASLPTGTGKIEAPISSEKAVPVPMDIQEASANIFSELGLSERGYRYVTEQGKNAGEVRGVSSTFPDWVPEPFRSKKLFDSVIEKTNLENAKFSKPELDFLDVIRERVANQTGRPTSDIDFTAITKDFRVKNPGKNPPINILPKPLKGLENRPITGDEVANLKVISETAGLSSDTVTATMRVLTGKQNVGDLTHAEYVSLSNQLGRMPKAEKYSPSFIPEGTGLRTYFGTKFSPRGRFASAYETRTGTPLASNVVFPMEDAYRLMKRNNEIYQGQKAEIFGKFERGQKYAEERRLINQYTLGNKEAITANSSLTPEMKTELISVGEKLRSWYDSVHASQEFGIPVEQFRKNYAPGVRDFGGRFQLYKADMGSLPESMPFFAKFQKSGTLSPLVDDASALFDIYVSSGLKDKYITPVLERMASDKALSSSPKIIQDWVKNYVGEKLGYASEFDRVLLTMAEKMNKKFGWNLPPEGAKMISDDLMQTMYSSALGLPRADAVVRDFITTDAIRHARLGSRLEGTAYKKAFSKEGIEYVRSKGWLVENIAKEHGQEIATGSTLPGFSGKAREVYNKYTEATLKPYSGMDNRSRALTAFQAEMQFDELISRLNKGEITWQDVEKSQLFNGLSKPSKNFIRQNLVSKNLESARDHVVTQIIDEVNFPYRRGAGAPISDGTEGKILTGLSSWNINAFHTAGRWLQTGKIDNFVRLFSRLELARRTLDESFGIDASRYTQARFLLNATYSPAIQFGNSVVNFMTSFIKDNRADINKNAGEIARSIQALGGLPGAIPSSLAKGEVSGGGVGFMNLENFWKSFNSAGEPGVPPGKYRIFTQNGATKSFGDFTDIFLSGLGFTSSAVGRENKLLTDISNAKTDREEISKEISRLIIDGIYAESEGEKKAKLNQAVEMMKENRMQKDMSDLLRDYNLPLSYQQFEGLPADLKAVFGPRVEESFRRQLK